jgi:hypothetical protein
MMTNLRFVAFPATEYDEVLSGYQPGEMVERCANQRFEDQDEDRGQRWSSKRWFAHRSTI